MPLFLEVVLQLGLDTFDTLLSRFANHNTQHPEAVKGETESSEDVGKFDYKVRHKLWQRFTVPPRKQGKSKGVLTLAPSKTVSMPGLGLMTPSFFAGALSNAFWKKEMAGAISGYCPASATETTHLRNKTLSTVVDS